MPVPRTAAVLLLAAALPTLTSTVARSQDAPDLRPGIDFAALDAAPARDSAAFAAFAQQNGGTWWTRWCPATGTPLEIFGTGLPIADWHDSLADARVHANAALVAYAQLLGLHDDEFREAIGAPFGRVFSFTFEQYHRGIPVIDGRADVRVHRSGRIAFLGSRAFQVPAGLPVVPAIASDAADAIAWLALGKLRQQPLAGKARATRLVIWGDADSDRLATVALCWEVPVDAVDRNGDGPIGRYYVDALTGAVRHYTNDKHSCGLHGCSRHGEHGGPGGDAPPPAITPTTVTVMGWARDGVSTLTPATSVPMPGLEISVPGIGTVVTDAAGQFTVDLTAAANVNVNMDGIHYTLIAGSSPATAAATLQPGVPATITLLSSGASANQLAHTTCGLWIHRVNEWARHVLGNSPELAGADQVRPTVNIASTCNAYYSGNSINFYAAGGGCNNTASSSVVAHEWGHGLDDRYGGIQQTQGLSEGWGDICSEYLLDNPVIAEGFSTPGVGIRDGRNTTLYPPPAEVHAAGQVWMGFAWKFRENLRASLGTQQAIAISESAVIGSIVANAFDQPTAVNQVFIADDDDGNLVNGVPHYGELTAACQVHQLPFPVRQLGAVTAQLPDTTVQMEPRMLVATAVPYIGTFTQLNLFYDDGAPHQVVMVPTGNPHEYRALLPGLPAPTTLTWHIEAQHSTGGMVRLPVVLDNHYDVYALTRFHFDDFENGGVGWTHGSTLGSDDWQIGAPLGTGAPGWSDPPAAFSGTVCAGNNLAGDGAYAASSENWLRSPPIDCTGKYGVRVRFKRWLTVDSIRHDMAILRCNGSAYWVNAPTGLLPIVDGAWVEQDARLTNADNNPATVIEWSLRTDATVAFGGWTIDDVELLTTSQPAPLPNTLTVSPPMALQGSAMNIALHTQQPNAPFLLLAGGDSGPTVVPGVPPLQLGAFFADLGGATSAGGNFAAGFTVPLGVALQGLQWYYQALTLDQNQQIVATNPTTTLFTQ